MMPLRRILSYLLATLLLTGISFAELPPGTQLETLSSNIDAIRLKHHVPAVAFILVSPDKVIYSNALGIRDRNTNQAATVNTLFRIGSITKAFTSLAMLKLQEQGKLSLSDPMSMYVNDAPLYNQWRKTHPVRIAHLLEHTSGLPDLTKAEFDSNDPAPLTTRQGLFFNKKPRHTRWPPGLHKSYTNVGAGYAAYVLEKVTGRRYEDFVKENIFAPLEMKKAGFFLDQKTRRELATGYDTDGESVIPYWHMILRPFGAINTTTREMGHFVQMLLNRGIYKGKRLLQEASIARMEKPETTLAARAGLEYGYGLGNYQHVHKGFLFHGHGGDGDGYLAHYAYNRYTNLGYFVVINAFKHDALNTIRDKIEDYIIADSKPPGAKTVSVPIADLKELTGTYQAVTYRFPGMSKAQVKRDQVRVILIDDILYSRTSEGKRTQLIPVTAKLFRRVNDPVATIAFISYGNEMYLQGETGNYRRLK